MRNQLNELKPCEIHLGHFANYCIAGFMKQMQCNVTPSLNIIKTTTKQVWLSVLNIRRTTWRACAPPKRSDVFCKRRRLSRPQPNSTTVINPKCDSFFKQNVIHVQQRQKTQKRRQGLDGRGE